MDNDDLAFRLTPEAWWTIAAWQWSWRDEIIPYVSSKAHEWGWDHKTMLRAMRELMSHNLVTCQYLVDLDTGIPHGCSYQLTDPGIKFKKDAFPWAKSLL